MSMIVGAVLFVGGIAMRAGVLGPVRAAVAPTPSAPSGSVIAQATPTARIVTPPPTVAPTAIATPTPTSFPTPTPTATPTAGGELLFADDFDTQAAWPTGKVTGGKARYAGGWYVVDLTPIDLPGYITCAAGDGPLPAGLTIEATMTLAGRDAQAGLFVADATPGTRIGVLLSASGRVTIVRDSLESFDVLGSGSTNAPSGPVRLTLVVGPTGTTAMVDGQAVASIRERLKPASFGLVIWAQTATGAVRVDHFEVRSTAA
jgi:hypothetical protein